MKQLLWYSSEQFPDTRGAIHWWRNGQKMERPIRGFVWIVHGLGEHGARYDCVSRFLNQLDFDVIAVDLPGHGLSRSEGHSKNIVSFPEMRRELNHAYSFWVEEGPLSSQKPDQSPWYILGHSMGALLSLSWMLDAKVGRHPFKYRFAERAFLSAPPLGLKLPVPWAKKQAAYLAKKLAPNLKMGNEIDPEMLSYDSANVSAYRQDPLVHGFATPRNFVSMLETADDVKRRAQDIEIPVCLAVGKDDPIVNPQAIEEYYGALGTHKRLLMVEHAKHEIFNDLCKKEIYEAAASWFV